MIVDGFATDRATARVLKSKLTSDIYSTQNEPQCMPFQLLKYFICSIPYGYRLHVTSNYNLSTYAFTMDVISNADGWIKRENCPSPGFTYRYGHSRH